MMNVAATVVLWRLAGAEGRFTAQSEGFHGVMVNFMIAVANYSEKIATDITNLMHGYKPSV